MVPTSESGEFRPLLPPHSRVGQHKGWERRLWECPAQVQIPAVRYLAGYLAFQVSAFASVKWGPHELIYPGPALWMGVWSHIRPSLSSERPHAWDWMSPPHHHLEILNNVIFEFVFCKWRLMGQCIMCPGLGASAHTWSCLPLRPKDGPPATCSPSPGSPCGNGDSETAGMCPVRTQIQQPSLQGEGGSLHAELWTAHRGDSMWLEESEQEVPKIRPGRKAGWVRGSICSRPAITAPKVPLTLARKTGRRWNDERFSTSLKTKLLEDQTSCARNYLCSNYQWSQGSMYRIGSWENGDLREIQNQINIKKVIIFQLFFIVSSKNS